MTPTSNPLCAQDALVRARGELDLHTSVVLREALVQACEQARDLVVVDLAEVTFMDCAALNVVLEARQRLKSRGADLFVRNPSPRCVRVLSVTGTLHLLSEGDETAERRTAEGGTAEAGGAAAGCDRSSARTGQREATGPPSSEQRGRTAVPA